MRTAPKNQRGSIVEEGEAYSCIEHSRHVGSEQEAGGHQTRKVTGQWRRMGVSRDASLSVYSIPADTNFTRCDGPPG